MPLCAAFLAGCQGSSGPGAAQPVAAVSPLLGTPEPESTLLQGLDPDDRSRADQARLSALEVGKPGTSISWKSPVNPGRFGSVVAGPKFEREGLTCRQFTQTVYLDGVPQTGRSSACRNPEGGWHVIS